MQLIIQIFFKFQTRSDKEKWKWYLIPGWSNPTVWQKITTWNVSDGNKKAEKFETQKSRQIVAVKKVRKNKAKNDDNSVLSKHNKTFRVENSMIKISGSPQITKHQLKTWEKHNASKVTKLLLTWNLVWLKK